MGKSSPKAPDYEAAAERTAESSKESMRDQTWANRVNQYNPWGSIEYNSERVIDPATGQPVTKWTQNQTLTDLSQQALDKQMAMTNQKSDFASQLMDKAGNELLRDTDWNSFQEFGSIPQAWGAEAPNQTEFRHPDPVERTAPVVDENDYSTGVPEPAAPTEPYDGSIVDSPPTPTAPTTVEDWREALAQYRPNMGRQGLADGQPESNRPPPSYGRQGLGEEQTPPPSYGRQGLWQSQPQAPTPEQSQPPTPAQSQPPAGYGRQGMGQMQPPASAGRQGIAQNSPPQVSRTPPNTPPPPELGAGTGRPVQTLDDMLEDLRSNRYRGNQRSMR